MSQYRIDSFLAARLFLKPQLLEDRIYFVSDLSGRISLYAMDRGGSVPEPLIPPDIALQHPHHISGELFHLFPALNKLLVMIDQDGNENYQPHLLPLEGGVPEPLFGDQFTGQQVVCQKADPEKNIAIFHVDPRRNPLHRTFRYRLDTGEQTELGTSVDGNDFLCASQDYSRIVLADSYTWGDIVLYLWDEEEGERKLLFGTPVEARGEGEQVPPNGIEAASFTEDGEALLLLCSIFDDRFGLAYLPLAAPEEIEPVKIEGLVHAGLGELQGLKHLAGNRYNLVYNIDGCSYSYEGTFDAARRLFTVEAVICGTGTLSDGVMEGLYYDKPSGDYVLSFSTAVSPTQLYTIERAQREVKQHTRERVLGIPQHLLSSGEDASYTSHDGLQISARLYRPAAALNYEGKRPVIYYIHGGPQSQERPDFAWFSMPLIQFFTLNGFAVFVPNVRGSTGYGIAYMKQVDRDWGGRDRLDHVEALRHLRTDPELDLDRVGVMGRSYGGYMTLTLTGRHPALWKAACDIFGPYNLFSFQERLPETWKTYFYQALGHPEKDREFLEERSPSTHLHRLACPLLVIQGQNDPRVVERESRDLVETLRAQGKEVDYLLFENEGHDILKFENKVHCYNTIVDFFKRHLQP